MGVEHHITDATKVTLSIAGWLSIAGGLVWLGMQIQAARTQLDAFKEMAPTLLTKADLAASKKEIRNELRHEFATEGVVVDCPVITVRGLATKPCRFLGFKRDD